MATTVTYPSDPVVNGATELQATSFNPVLADYQALSWAGAQNYVRGHGYQFSHFPRTNAEDPTWTFYVRSDMAGVDAMRRNLIGIQVVSETLNRQVFLPSQGAQATIPIVQQRVTVYNWFPTVVTLTAGDSVTRFNCVNSSYIFTLDPEAGTILDGEGSRNALEEAVGFLLGQTAASKANSTPASRALTGLMPLT